VNCSNDPSPESTPALARARTIIVQFVDCRGGSVLHSPNFRGTRELEIMGVDYIRCAVIEIEVDSV
jgi:hypothetical protein